MATGPRYIVKFRRRRNDSTNYQKRLRLLKSGLPRLVVRKSNKKIISQIIIYSRKGDKTQINCVSTELIKLGWKHNLKNRPASYLTGYLIAKKASEHKDIQKVVVDMGLNTLTNGNNLFAFLKGVKDFGSPAFDCDESVLPLDNIIFNVSGKDLSKDIESVKNKIKTEKKEIKK